MTDSRVDRRVVIAAQFAAILMIAPVAFAGDRSNNVKPGSVWQVAQNTAPAPRRLLPRKPVEPESPPAEPESVAPVAPDPFAEDPSEYKARSGIEVDRLRGPDPDEIGTIDFQTGGLVRTMWQSTPAKYVVHLMRQLPDSMASPTLRDILRRLLLTAADAPAREEGRDSPNLVALRIERLQTLGFLGSASALMEIAPRRQGDGRLLRLHADNLLMRGENEAACAETRRRDIPLEKTYWQYLLIFCQVLDGNLEEAALGANLLAESVESADPAFAALIDALVRGENPSTGEFAEATPLLFAVLHYARLPIPAALFEQASPPLLAMIAAFPDGDLDLRLAAAERAARFGALTPERLTRIYAEAAFSGEDVENALSIAESVRSPRGRALLYQAAAAQNVPTARAEVLQKALSLAREDGVYPLSVRLFSPMLGAILPSAELSWFAADAARALYALGRADLAEPWVTGLRYEVSRDPDVKLAADSLWAAASLSLPSAAEDAAAADAWRAAVTALMPTQARRRFGDAYALLEMQGLSLSGGQWRDVLGNFERRAMQLPDHTYRSALADAATAGRVGEALLLAAIVAGHDGPGEMDIGVLREIVVSLRQVGLMDEARALVIEAAVEKGL